MTMTRTLLVLLVALALGACEAPSPDATPVAGPSSVAPAPAATVEAAPSVQGAPQVKARYDGYGDVRFGMDEAAFRAAWQGELQGRGDQVCFYLWPKRVKVPADFAFMFEHGRFVRYDVGTTTRVAPGGGKVGMRAERIRALYPGATGQPHKYVPGGQYLRVEHADGKGVLVFDIGADGRVGSWRAGVPPQVDYVEGCS